MTREKAIKIIEVIDRRYMTLENDERNALKMAVELLEQEPCEDAISRENLLLWLDDIKESARKHVAFLLDVQRYIRSMPPVTPQPKTGHWIAVENEEMKTVGYYCSECDLPMETEYQTKFCPNCRSKMEEELQWFDIA